MSTDLGMDGLKVPGRSLSKPVRFKNAAAANGLGRRAHYIPVPHHCVCLWLPGAENGAVGLK